MLTQLCTKLNDFFASGKQIFETLQANPVHGKQLLVQNHMATNAPTAVREWILPFLMHFTDLLKVLWTLWRSLRTKEASRKGAECGVGQLARLVGGSMLRQITEREMMQQQQGQLGSQQGLQQQGTRKQLQATQPQQQLAQVQQQEAQPQQPQQPQHPKPKKQQSHRWADSG